VDFEMHYTPEQEALRAEVRAWLDANLPAGFEETVPWDSDDYTPEMYEFAKDFRHKLGQKGWLAASWAKEYGGGGMTSAEQIVIDEELAKRIVPNTGDLGIVWLAPALMVWGTEEQKQRWMPLMLKGEKIVWQAFTEPEAGSDLASLQMRAVEDGDHWVLNGNKIFIGTKHYPDLIYTLAVTDPEAPRHQNISAFVIDPATPGVSWTPLDLAMGGGKSSIFFEDARVPKANMIGGEGGRGKGWRVAQSTLEIEHGGGGRIVEREPLVERFIQYCKTAIRHGQPLAKDPAVRAKLGEMYARSQVGRLIGVRNYDMRLRGERPGFRGPQFALWNKLHNPWMVKQIMDITGPVAAATDPDFRVLRGRVEFHQREGIVTHPGGTPEIQKVIMAQALGLSRATARTAAPGGGEHN